QNNVCQGNGFFVSVESHKFMFFRNIHFLRMPGSDWGVAGVDAVTESIRHGYQFDIMAGGQCLEYRASTSSATTDNCNFYLVRPGSISARHGKGAQQRSSCKK